MNRQRRPGRRGPAACGELHADDGTNPRDDRRSDRHSRPDRRTQRASRAAARSLAAAMTELNDPILCELEIVRVAATASGVLEVEVNWAAGALPKDPGAAPAALARLALVRGYLRSGLARDLNRRRTPELRFRWADLQTRPAEDRS
jgi:ribosome-binding factor A